VCSALACLHMHRYMRWLLCDLYGRICVEQQQVTFSWTLNAAPNHCPQYSRHQYCVTHVWNVDSPCFEVHTYERSLHICKLHCTLCRPHMHCKEAAGVEGHHVGAHVNDPQLIINIVCKLHPVQCCIPGSETLHLQELILQTVWSPYHEWLSSPV